MNTPNLKTYMVAYDTSDDKTRRHVIKALRKAGLYRIQKSIFLGASTPERMREVAGFLDYLVQSALRERPDDPSPDRYFILLLDENALKQFRWFSPDPLDLDFYTARKTVVFF